MSLSWVLYALTVGATFGLAAWAAEHALLALRQPVRWIWSVTIAASLAVPLVIYLAPARPPTPVPVDPLPVQWLTSIDPGVDVGAGDPRLPMWLNRAFVYVWMLASATVLSWLAWNGWRIRRGPRTWRTRRIDGVDVLESPSTGPAVLGLVGGRIVVPRWLPELDSEAQRLIVLHERVHQRQRDPLLIWAAWLVCALVPWNAAVWWQLRRLRLAIEIDCDRRVLASGVPVARYGDLLLEVARRIGLQPRLLATLFETRSFLERRIRVMTSRPSRRALRTLASLGALAVVIGFVRAAPVPDKPMRLDATSVASSAPGPAQPEDLPAAAVRDTPPYRVHPPIVAPGNEFRFTPYTVKPRCIDNCTPEALIAHFDAATTAPRCQVTIGLRIDTDGTVSATDMLKSSDPGCDEAARSWARTTRWTPARNRDQLVVVWIAQPVSYVPNEQAGAAEPGLSPTVVPPPPTMFAPDDSVKSALRLAMVAQEKHRHDHGTYASTIGDLDLEVTFPEAVRIEIRRDGDAYVMIARHALGDAVFCARSGNAIVEGDDC